MRKLAVQLSGYSFAEYCQKSKQFLEPYWSMLMSLRNPVGVTSTFCLSKEK